MVAREPHMQGENNPGDLGLKGDCRMGQERIKRKAIHAGQQDI